MLSRLIGSIGERSGQILQANPQNTREKYSKEKHLVVSLITAALVLVISMALGAPVDLPVTIITHVIDPEILPKNATLNISSCAPTVASCQHYGDWQLNLLNLKPKEKYQSWAVNDTGEESEYLPPNIYGAIIRNNTTGGSFACALASGSAGNVSHFVVNIFPGLENGNFGQPNCTIAAIMATDQ